MKPLPAVVITKFRSAAAQPKNRRLKAIDASVRWAKEHFPEYFLPVRPKDLPPIGMPTLTNYMKQLTTSNFKEITK